MRLITDPASLAVYLDSHAGARGCVFVPTMGALHEGHAALVREAARLAGRSRAVIVSIFVNPTQFNDPADLARYPRTPDADVTLCAAAGAHAIFAPRPADVYPPGQDIPTPTLPEPATRPGLEDAHRPGHFAGVLQVVKRLFDLVQPASAVFGEKDWQQLAVVRAMVANLGLPIAIHGLPTVREPDGLAMSSRNRFLTVTDRPRARAVSGALRAADKCGDVAAAESAMRAELDAAGLRVQYAVVRDAQSLGPVRAGLPARSLIAATLGSVRLIDNGPWKPAV